MGEIDGLSLAPLIFMFQHSQHDFIEVRPCCSYQRK